MYIKELVIENFRCFGENENKLKIPMQLGLNALVGENDAGKTAIIDALRMLLGTRDQESIRPTIEDFYLSESNEQAQEFSIVAIFSKLSDRERSRFAEYLTYQPEDQDHPVILRVTFRAAQYSEKIRSTIFSGLPTGAHGLKEIDQETRDHLRATYLRPLRDAEKEMDAGRNSRISKILKKQASIDIGDDMVDLSSVSGEKFGDVINKLGIVGIARLVNQLLERQPAVNSTKDKLNEDFLQPLQMAGDDLSATLGISPDADEETLKRQMLEKVGISLENTRGKRGLGSNNLLYIACEMLLLDDSTDRLAFLLIEEPEAHLHPQRQLKLTQYLQQKIETDPQLQILLSTHSPTLASKLPIKCMTMVHKGKIMPLAVTSIPENDYTFLERFIDATKANLFFCRGLMIVEGDAENLLVPTLSKLLGHDFTENGVSIVNVGHTGLSRYANLFAGTNIYPNPGIKVACLHDLDLIPFPVARELELASVNEEQKSLWDEVDMNIEKGEKPDFVGLGKALPKNIISSFPGNTSDSEKTAAVEREYDGDFVKGFYSGPWTLEYSLAFHGLEKEVTIAACLAKAEHAKRYDKSEHAKIIAVAEKYFIFLESNYPDKAILAGKIYELLLSPVSVSESITDSDSGLILKQKASKAAAGQHLAMLLEEENQKMKKDKWTDSDCIEHWKKRLPRAVIDAITHVTPREALNNE